MSGSATTRAESVLTGQPIALAVENVSKSYGATRAVDDVSLEISAGVIHALMGGNGSGKSTLIKMLAGVVAADHGRFALGGDWVDARHHSPVRAKASGLHFVHQQNSTFPDLTVAENLALGRGFERTVVGSIAWSAQRARAREVLGRFELHVEPDMPMSRLSAAAQMMVAIARALQDQDEAKRGVLVLDEPTASLPKHEVDVLLAALRRYSAEGQTIIYVSHRLDEVISLADEVTVLRNGRVASRLFGTGITHDSLVEGITGATSGRVRQPASATLSTDDTTDGSRVPVSRGTEPVLTLRRPVSPGGEVTDALVLRAGEIVGVAGLLGSGRSRLLKQIFGVVPRDDIEVILEAGPLAPSDVRTAMKRGIALVPEDRLREAAFLELSIAENLSISCLSDYSRVGWISPLREKRVAQGLIASFGIRAPGSSAPLSALSGGNQQKVVLARWLQRRPEVLLLDEPTQGVDVVARNEIHEFIRTAAAAGTAVLVVSSEFDELAAVAHRAVVVSGGEIVASVNGPLTEDTLNDVVYSQEKSL